MLGLYEQTVRWGKRLNLSHRTGVYSIINLVTSDLYIGSAARDFQKRWNKHTAELSRNRHHAPHLQAAWNKYGQSSFEFGVVEDCSPELCVSCEQKWIDFFKPTYNTLMVAGSVFGYKQSEETKRKRLESRGLYRHTEEAREKMRIARTGHVMTDETKRKLSEINKGKRGGFKGRTHTAESKAKMSAALIGRVMSEKSKQKRREANIKNAQHKSLFTEDGKSIRWLNHVKK